MFLVAGLILLLAGSSWFTGAATVGWICLGVFAVEAVFYFAMVGAFIFADVMDARKWGLKKQRGR